MQIVTTTIPPDVEYVLDAALEHNELDAACHVALKLYAPRGDLMRIVDRDWALGREELRPRLAMCAALNDFGDDILRQLPADKRGAIALAGASHVKAEVIRLAWTLATWAMQDEIVGGCLKPYKRCGTRWVQRYEPSPKQRRQLYAPGWIRRYTKTNDDARLLRAMGSRTLSRLVGIDCRARDVVAAAESISTDMQAQHEGYRRTNERAINRLGASFRPLDRKATARRRSVIKRAVHCASAILSAKMISDFAGGRPVVLPGQSIALEVARIGSAADLGHGSLSVLAIDPVSKRQLASLCVYHERTPALDQLTALALAMQAGEEAEIIATANLSRVTELGMQHPLISERGKTAREMPWRPRDDVQEKNEAYWLATKPLWTDTLGVFTLGRMWGRMQ